MQISSAVRTATDVRSEAVMLASQAEKASLEAQHKMREHGLHASTCAPSICAHISTRATVCALFDKLDEHHKGTLTVNEV